MAEEQFAILGLQAPLSRAEEAYGGRDLTARQTATFLINKDREKYGPTRPTIMSSASNPDKVFIESCHTGRYLLDAAPSGDVRSIRGNEGGWIHKNSAGAHCGRKLYYNRAYWTITNV